MAFNVPKVPTIFDVPIFDEKTFEQQFNTSDFSINEDNIISIVDKGYITSAIAASGDTTFSESNIGTSIHNITGSSVTVSVASGQKVLVLIQGIADLDTADANLDVWIRRNTTDIAELSSIGDIGGTDATLAWHIHCLDDPGVGSHTYHCRVDSDESNTDVLDGRTTVIVLN